MKGGIPMEQTVKLYLVFKTTDQKEHSIIIDRPRQDLAGADVKSVMDQIVSSNVFDKNGALIGIVEAKYITRTENQVFNA